MFSPAKMNVQGSQVLVHTFEHWCRGFTWTSSKHNS